MTVTDIRPTNLPGVDTAQTAAHQLALLEAMLADPRQAADWPEIRQAIEYLTATTVREA